MKRAAALWTGGKDCSLALHEARRSGLVVDELVTFAPPFPAFLAHPLPFLKRQARAMGLRHRTVEVRPPLEPGYARAVRALRGEGIEALVTGDIAEGDGHPNWIRQVSVGAGIDVLTPLWGRDRRVLLSDLMEAGFKAVFSLVKRPWLTPEWVGRPMDRQAIDELGVIASRAGLDLCGENGEYHSLVLDGPTFRRGLRIAAFKVRERDGMSYMEIEELVDEEKQSGDTRRIKRCLRCGADFACGSTEATGRCWCDELPRIVPMSEEGCLCEKCLKAEIEALTAQRRAPQVGLCGACANARALRTKSESDIYLCEASAADRRLSKYPRLPVASCPGYVPKPI